VHVGRGTRGYLSFYREVGGPRPFTEGKIIFSACVLTGSPQYRAVISALLDRKLGRIVSLATHYVVTQGPVVRAECLKG
jgi:hypothetical protein